MIDVRRIYHVGRADFLERVRSRKLIVFLAVVAYLGYLVNVGGVNLAYTVTVDGERMRVVGEPTAALIGLKTALAGGAVVVFGAFYVMRNGLARDRRYGHAELVASTATSNTTYLLGKLASNVVLGGVVVATLGVAAVVNHAVHGVGATDPVALLAPLVVLTLPVCVLVGGVAVAFETVSWFDGTLGTVVHLALGTLALSALAGVGGALPTAVPVTTRLADLLGYLPVYQMTFDALTATVPGYGGGLPSVGTLQGSATFTYDGAAWPAWVVPQRLVVVVAGVVVTVATTVSFDRTRLGDGDGGGGLLPSPGRLVAALRERVGDSSEPTAGDVRAVEAIETTAVSERDAGGFWRLAAAEFRLAVRDRRWWWYAGVATTVVGPLALVATGGGSVPARGILLAVAFAWPLPVWSELGSRAYRHGTTDLLFSSEAAVTQVVAEWVAGVGVGLLVGVGPAALAVTTGETTLLAGVLAGVLFPPSLALAFGVWTHSERLFEVGYLLVWYVGPVNDAPVVNFLATGGDATPAVPAAFVGVSVVALGAAVLRRRSEVV